MDPFARYHPLVNFLFFALVTGFSMAIIHPVSQGISLVCACWYVIRAEGRKGVVFALKWCLPVLVLTAVINPAFSHQGVTVLLYLPTGNPLTLESIFYGLSAGIMIVTVMLWFVSFTRVISSDKFMYLFGRIIPALSLVLSMSLRFVPRFKGQLQKVKEAQACMGRDVSTGSLLHRLKGAVTVLSILVTWSLENAIQTADSMKSRGYGLPGRTAFSIYRIEARDKVALSCLGFCGLYVLLGAAASAFAFRYFPSIRWADFSPAALSFQFVYLLLCSTPLICCALEERKWKAIHSDK